MKKRFRNVTNNLLFILGIRDDYRVENLVISVGVAIIFLLFRIYGSSTISIIVGTFILLTPLLLQYNSYRQGYRRRIQVPLYIVLMSALVSTIIPPLIFPTLVSAFFIEDFTVFFSFDVISMKRTARILLAPIAKRELFVLIIGTLITSIITYIITKSWIVFTYPLFAYVMIAYSLIVVPPSYRPEEKRSFFEDFNARVAILYYIFNRYYMKKKMVDLGKEAGMLGHNYIRFIKRMSGIFSFGVYIGLATSPLFYPIIGIYSYVVPVALSGFLFILPHMVMVSKKKNRSGKIEKSQLIILSYLASMKSVSESFTNMMFNLRSNPNLAKLFGLEDEAKIYYQIYLSRGIESVALKEYADSIPNDYYRDTIRTMQDIEENEGVGATFRMLVDRLKDYSGRYIDRISASFENIGGNIISVIMLMETALPIMMFLSAPMSLPFMMFMGGVMSAVIMYFIATGTMPNLPSEYIYSKMRYRRASIPFILTASILTIVEKFLIPSLFNYAALLNIPVSFFVAWYYVSKRDLEINNILLNKFPDLLVLFSSALSRYNSVEKAMLELSQQPTFPKVIREEFIRIARMYTYINVQNLQYRGQYWYKYLLFLTSISAIYGITPRELYKTMSNFMLEFKRFFGAVKSFGMSMMFLTLISFVIMTIEINIAIQFLSVMSTMNTQASGTGNMGINKAFPKVTEHDIQKMYTLGYTSLLVVALLNGIGIAKIISGTIRDGRYVLVLFLLELALIYIGIHTNFGIHFQTSR